MIDVKCSELQMNAAHFLVRGKYIHEPAPICMVIKLRNEDGPHPLSHLSLSPHPRAKPKTPSFRFQLLSFLVTNRLFSFGCEVMMN